MIRAVHTGNWELHIAVLQVVTQYFFAHDHLIYAQMTPLPDMDALKISSLEVYKEFCQGNWEINKYADVPLCTLGADFVLESLNHSIKV
jgi:hypothetical protein